MCAALQENRKRRTGVPVVEGEADEDIEISLQHLVAADEAAHLSLAVLH